MFDPEYTYKMKQARLDAGLTQKKAAQLCGMTRIRWTHLETGYRIPNPGEYLKLRHLLGLRYLPSRPPKAVLELLSAGQRSTTSAKPYFASLDRPTFARYLAAKRRYPELTSRLTAIAKARRDFALCAYLCSKIATDSYLEAVYLLYLLALNATPCLKSPAALGYLPHPILDRSSHEYVGNRLLACFHTEDKHFFFQTAFATPRLWVADVLVWDGSWCIVEIDGCGHDSSEDKLKQEMLQIPVRRLSETALIGEIESYLIERSRLAS